MADVPVITMETVGAHALNAALKAGKPVSIGEITRYDFVSAFVWFSEISTY